MLSHCANPQCSKPFLRLREGKLFVVETGRSRRGDRECSPSRQGHHRRRHVERFWLCDRCAAVWTLIFDREQGIRLVPLPRPGVSVSSTGKVEQGLDSA